ncbi:porin family protein [Geobacter sp. FeAm09]|uniref:OmpW family outer membrane protein n=1 Tax=Geobacter sp. FeAm09 TaxID=2597769 RepID=UPI0011F064A9|nr:OmpW family outer membrane protein [Geobacter sp. FeAm09]QEM67321.1 porin family protein [Geobacter sp. FeAm09]
MKKTIYSCCLALSLFLAVNPAMAGDIKGRLGVTGRLGFLVPADSELSGRNASTDTAFVGGGGFIYGITNNIAAELDITHTDYDVHGFGEGGNAETTNFSLGAQYRFDVTVPQLTPYVGAGLDILINDFSYSDGTKTDVDNTVGVHVSGGVDYFVAKQVALNAQLKAVLSPNADINYLGRKAGNIDPMSISTTFGVRYFFN